MNSVLHNIKSFDSFINCDIDIIKTVSGQKPGKFNESISTMSEIIIKQYSDLNGDEDKELISKFIQRLEWVNKQCSIQGQTGVFTHTLSVLHSLKAKSTPKSQAAPTPAVSKTKGEPKAAAALSSVQCLRNKFEQTPPPAVMIPKATAPSRTVPTEEEKKHSLLESLYRRLHSLDLSSVNMKNDVGFIRSDIAKLENLSMMKEMDFTELESLLDLLVDPNPSRLRISEGEEQFVTLLLKEKGASDNTAAEYLKLQNGTVKNIQSAALKALKKQAGGDLSKLLEMASTINQGIVRRVQRERFESFLEKCPFPSSLPENFVTHFPTLVRGFEKATNTSAALLEDTWKKVCMGYDNGTAGKFSQLLLTYPSMNPKEHFPEFVAFGQKQFLHLLISLNTLDLPANNIPAALDMIVEQSNATARDLFNISYNEIYGLSHLWLFENVGHVVIPYCQEAAIHTNLGRGVCFANSIRREAAFLEVPLLEGTQIKMGSDDRSRYCQRIYQAQWEASKQRKMSLAEVEENVYHSYGLKLDHLRVINPPAGSNLYDHFIHELDHYRKSGRKGCLLSIAAPKAAHALNIQFDSENKIYRIIDDNFGVFSYKSFKEFKTELKKHVKYNYPEFNKIQMHFLCPNELKSCGNTEISTR